MKALIEMSFSSSASKRFNCETCLPKTMERRRCQQDKFDFDGNDNVLFPIIIEEGGSHFGFCPGKANWYPEVVAMFKTLVLCCELNKLPYSGCLMDQPARIIDILSWFAPVYKSLATAQRHGLLSREKKAVKGVESGNDNRGSAVSNYRRLQRGRKRH